MAPVEAELWHTTATMATFQAETATLDSPQSEYNGANSTESAVRKVPQRRDGVKTGILCTAGASVLAVATLALVYLTVQCFEGIRNGGFRGPVSPEIQGSAPRILAKGHGPCFEEPGLTERKRHLKSLSGMLHAIMYSCRAGEAWGPAAATLLAFRQYSEQYAHEYVQGCFATPVKAVADSNWLLSRELEAFEEVAEILIRIIPQVCAGDERATVSMRRDVGTAIQELSLLATRPDIRCWHKSNRAWADTAAKSWHHLRNATRLLTALSRTLWGRPWPEDRREQVPSENIDRLIREGWRVLKEKSSDRTNVQGITNAYLDAAVRTLRKQGRSWVCTDGPVASRTDVVFAIVVESALGLVKQALIGARVYNCRGDASVMIIRLIATSFRYCSRLLLSIPRCSWRFALSIQASRDVLRNAFMNALKRHRENLKSQDEIAILRYCEREATNCFHILGHGRQEGLDDTILSPEQAVQAARRYGDIRKSTAELNYQVSTCTDSINFAFKTWFDSSASLVDDLGLRENVEAYVSATGVKADVDVDVVHPSPVVDPYEGETVKHQLAGSPGWDSVWRLGVETVVAEADTSDCDEAVLPSGEFTTEVRQSGVLGYSAPSAYGGWNPYAGYAQRAVGHPYDPAHPFTPDWSDGKACTEPPYNAYQEHHEGAVGGNSLLPPSYSRDHSSDLAYGSLDLYDGCSEGAVCGHTGALAVYSADWGRGARRSASAWTSTERHGPSAIGYHSAVWAPGRPTEDTANTSAGARGLSHLDIPLPKGYAAGQRPPTGGRASLAHGGYVRWPAEGWTEMYSGHCRHEDYRGHETLWELGQSLRQTNKSRGNTTQPSSIGSSGWTSQADEAYGTSDAGTHLDGMHPYSKVQGRQRGPWYGGAWRRPLMHAPLGSTPQTAAGDRIDSAFGTTSQPRLCRSLSEGPQRLQSIRAVASATQQLASAFGAPYVGEEFHAGEPGLVVADRHGRHAVHAHTGNNSERRSASYPSGAHHFRDSRYAMPVRPCESVRARTIKKDGGPGVATEPAVEDDEEDLLSILEEIRNKFRIEGGEQ